MVAVLPSWFNADSRMTAWMLSPSWIASSRRLRTSVAMPYGGGGDQ